MWQQSNLIPIKKFQYLVDLAENIKDQVNDDRIPVDSENLPLELKPLGEAINALLEYDADRIQQEKMFTADASHELRTPLAGIRLQTQLAMQSHTDEERELALNNVIKSVDRATRMVEQLLIITRLTGNQVDLSMDKIELGQICEKIVDEFNVEALHNNIHITFYSEKNEHHYIHASEESVIILVQNLLSNALKFTPAGGKIEICLSRNNDTARLQVTDTGVGINKDQRERVLRRFQKGDNKNTSGTGLGLAIVKRIIELHSGTLSLNDNPKGKGLSVCIEFPLDY